MENKKINVRIDEGKTFFANEVTVNFNPMQMFFDFRCVSPRVDLRSKEGEINLSIEHNVVALEPYHAKQIKQMLEKAIDNYEKEFGKIEKPKAIEKLEKKAKKKGTDVKHEVPTYFG